MKPRDKIQTILIICFFILTVYSFAKIFFLIQTQSIQVPEAMIITTIVGLIVTGWTMILTFFFRLAHSDLNKLDAKETNSDTITTEL